MVTPHLPWKLSTSCVSSAGAATARKHVKYAGIATTHTSVPVAVESMEPLGPRSWARPRWLSHNAALCHTFTKIGTNEGHTILINLRPWGILGVTAFCLVFDEIQYGHRPSLYMQFYPFYGYLRGSIDCTASNNHSKNIPPPFVTGLWTSFGGVNVIFFYFWYFFYSFSF